LASIPTGSTLPTFTFTAPSGVFFLRVHTLSGAARSAASNEIRVFVNVAVPPSAPSGLLSLVNGSSLALAWKNTLGGGTPTGLVLDVSGDIETAIPLGLTDTFSVAGVPPGTYTIGLRAVNAAGSSLATGPLTLTFPEACSGRPARRHQRARLSRGPHRAVSWESPATGVAPTGYLLNVTGGFSGSFRTAARARAAWSRVGPTS
jgi:hypothetical protein